jgi:hypothetical protein
MKHNKWEREMVSPGAKAIKAIKVVKAVKAIKAIKASLVGGGKQQTVMANRHRTKAYLTNHSSQSCCLAYILRVKE